MSKQQEKRFQSVNQFRQVLENGGFVGIVQKIVEKVLIKVQGPFFLNPDRTLFCAVDLRLHKTRMR